MHGPPLELRPKSSDPGGYARSDRLLWTIANALLPLLLLVFAWTLLYAGAMTLFHSPRLRAAAPEKSVDEG